MISEPTVQAALHAVLGLLVDGEYETLEAMTQGKHLSATEMREAIESYGRTLIQPPAGELPPDTDVFLVEGSSPRRLVAVMPLMTKEEGVSDLTVEMTLNELAPRIWLTEIDNIHVM
ncbi:hypothetical protein K1W54_13980 [Micromonospora sp. CPCC 205371]|nr:hypothetical protein [Micromonospora sp. CPCC 205371]